MSSDHDLERKADSPNRKLMVPQFVRIGASLFKEDQSFSQEASVSSADQELLVRSKSP